MHLTMACEVQVPKHGQIRTEFRRFRVPSRGDLTFPSCWLIQSVAKGHLRDGVILLLLVTSIVRLIFQLSLYSQERRQLNEKAF